jgi:hypothetical protein
MIKSTTYLCLHTPGTVQIRPILLSYFTRYHLPAAVNLSTCTMSLKYHLFLLKDVFLMIHQFEYMYKYELILEIYFFHPMKGYAGNSQYIVENKMASRLSATKEIRVFLL